VAPILSKSWPLRRLPHTRAMRSARSRTSCVIFCRSDVGNWLRLSDTLNLRAGAVMAERCFLLFFARASHPYHDTARGPIGAVIRQSFEVDASNVSAPRSILFGRYIRCADADRKRQGEVGLGAIQISSQRLLPHTNAPGLQSMAAALRYLP